MAKRHQKPGPDPDRLTIEADWREAVKKALGAEKPPEGWPERDDDRPKKRRQKKPSKKAPQG